MNRAGNSTLNANKTIVIGNNWDPVLGCQQSDNVVSVLDMGLLASYDARSRSLRGLLMPGQPFSFAGDTTLTSVRDNEGNYFVKVDRLFGNEFNQFTMVNVLREFPADPPDDTIALGGARRETADSLPTPYTFTDLSGIRHPSTNSQTAVYFAVNPSLGMFKAFAR